MVLAASCLAADLVSPAAVRCPSARFFVRCQRGALAARFAGPTPRLDELIGDELGDRSAAERGEGIRRQTLDESGLQQYALDAAGLDPAVVQREKDILADKFRQQGKPEAMIEKITESGLKTFYKEQTLLEQPFIFDDKKSVGQAVKDSEGKVGAPVKLTGFVRYALGEGIEKQESDFAAEVAAAAGSN